MQTEASNDLDLDAYLARVGYDARPRADAETLVGLHFAHTQHIPFENLDIFLGRPIRIDLEGLQAKLVRSRRGGYCFEHNTLLAAALEAIGFRVTRLAARVRWGTDRILPRTHMLLRVDVGGRPWLADVGFGGWGLLEPIPWRSGEVVRQHGWTYRLDEEAGLWVLRTFYAGEWKAMYAFTLEPQLAVDFEVANHYVSTYPESRFVRTITAQRAMPDVRLALVNRELSEFRPDSSSIRPLGDEDERIDTLARIFGLEFPTGTRFHSPIDMPA